MRSILITITVGFALCAQSQTADHYLIGSLGGDFSNAGINVNYSGGEAVIPTLSSQGVIVTQGFQQPSLVSDLGLEELVQGDNLVLFPNPVSDELNIQFTDNTVASTEVNLAVYNAVGQLVISESVNLIEGDGATIQLYTGALETGHYQVHIQTKDGKIARSKFIKQ